MIDYTFKNMPVVSAVQYVQGFINGVGEGAGVIITSVVSADIYNRLYVIRGTRSAYRRLYIVDVLTGLVFEPVIAALNDEEAVAMAITAWGGAYTAVKQEI